VPDLMLGGKDTDKQELKTNFERQLMSILFQYKVVNVVVKPKGREGYPA
jgi:hypothetical protein